MPDREWWHGSTVPLTEIRPFLHVGSTDQARMRSGHRAHLACVVVGQANIRRMKDKGSWREKDLRGARSRGFDAIVYLNRFEGIPPSEFEEARLSCEDLDTLTDAAFRKMVPSATDSLIILSTEIARLAPELSEAADPTH